MQIIDHLSHPRVTFRAKDFDEQEGHRLTMLVQNEKSIETGVYLHWFKSDPIDIAIDISCMSGCTRQCIFCAAGQQKPKALDADQILEQVGLAIERVRPCHGEFLDRIMKEKKITFSFQAIGEPADPMVCQEVLKAINALRQKYTDWNEVQFSISSLLDNIEPLEDWAPLDLQTLQFSLHAPNDTKREKLLGQRPSTDIGKIFSALDKFHSASPTTQVKINYVLISGQNDTQEDRVQLLDLLKSRPQFYLKISYLNETSQARRRGLVTSKRHRTFLDNCKKAHPFTYDYGAFREVRISCGQLASYALDERHAEHIAYEIESLYEDIRSGRCTLFLGAGASYTAWDARELAKELYGGLNRKAPYSEDLGLAEIADAYEQLRKRPLVDERVRNALKAASVPGAMIDIARYPWRAIYTTNYDEFVERAYETAIKGGFAVSHCHPILTYNDFFTSSSGAVPYVKLHGSVSSGLRTVMSETDYLDGYAESIEFFLNRFEVDRLAGSVLFIGYSFRDQFIKQWLFNLRRRLKLPQGRLWAVQPQRETTPDDADRLREQFGVRLIPTDFASLMRELEVLRRRPVVMASGSMRKDVRGGTDRIGETDKIEKLCSLLGIGLSIRRTRLITGATATDKVGYLIGRNMKEKGLVTTYLWHGSEKEAVNEVDQMIGVREIGGRPAAVIERLMGEASLVIVIGGGAMTLREALTAISKGIPVIPVCVGGHFASDVIHAFLAEQHDAVGALSADIGIDAEVSGRIMEILTRDRLKCLSLCTYDPTRVAEVIFEVLDHAAGIAGRIFVGKDS